MTHKKHTDVPFQSKCGDALSKGYNIDEDDVEMAYLREWYLKREDLKHLVVQ